MKRSFGLTLIALMAVALAQPASVPRELAQRFVPDADVYVGTLPPERRLGFAFPLPPGVRVVGASASRENDTAFDFASLYLASPRPAAALGAFYQAAFAGRGWRLGTDQQTGFLPAGAFAFAEALTFCRTRGGRDTDLYLTFARLADRTLVDAQLTSYPADPSSSACDPGDRPPLPELAAPAGSRSGVAEFFSGFDPGNGASVIVLDTPIGAEGVLGHYARQLEASGWRERGRVAGAAARVATYGFRSGGRSFVGTLQVTPLALPGRYLAQLVVVKP